MLSWNSFSSQVQYQGSRASINLTFSHKRHFIPNIYFSECSPTHYRNVSGACTSCLNLVIGSGGEPLIDGDPSSSVIIPGIPDGVYSQFTMSVNEKCCQGNMFNVDVTVNQGTTCDIIRSTVFVDSESNCNGVNLDKCIVVTSLISSGKTMCSMKCKCADSAEYCQFHLYSLLSQQDLEIWKISITD